MVLVLSLIYAPSNTRGQAIYFRGESRYCIVQAGLKEQYSCFSHRALRLQVCTTTFDQQTIILGESNFFFEAPSHRVQADLQLTIINDDDFELLIILCLPLQCWDYRCLTLLVRTRIHINKTQFNCYYYYY